MLYSGMDKKQRIKYAIEIAGGQVRVAKACGVSQPAVSGWINRGLPRTDWTGETNYAGAIERLTNGVITKDWLLTGGK